VLASKRGAEHGRDIREIPTNQEISIKPHGMTRSADRGYVREYDILFSDLELKP